MEFHVEDHPNPLDIEVLEAQIRREASAAMGLGDEVDLAIFVRDAGTVVAGISGWTWGDCCELQNLWVQPSLRGRGLATRLIAAAEAEAAARGCSQTVHFTYAFQARALYERNGYELVGRVEDFPSGTDVLWYRKRLQPHPSSRRAGARLDATAVRDRGARWWCGAGTSRYLIRGQDRGLFGLGFKVITSRSRHARAATSRAGPDLRHHARCRGIRPESGGSDRVTLARAMHSVAGCARVGCGFRSRRRCGLRARRQRAQATGRR